MCKYSDTTFNISFDLVLSRATREKGDREGEKEKRERGEVNSTNSISVVRIFHCAFNLRCHDEHEVA